MVSECLPSQLPFCQKARTIVANYTAFPRVSVNPIIAELLDFPKGILSSRVLAILSSANGKLDFHNFVFRAADLDI
jgi:hypothetical protein